MADNVFEYDTTAGNNVLSGSQSLAENVMKVPAINDVMRTSYAHFAAYLEDMAGKNTVGGTADAITLTTSMGFADPLVDGLTTAFQAASAVTGASTINVDATGAIALRRNGDTATEANDVIAGGIYAIRYDASADLSAGAWILLNREPAAAVTPTAQVYMHGHINGLGLSNGTDATNDIDIAAGEATSDASTADLMVLSSGITKQLDASWAVGTNAGGLDTGSIANTTYHMWLIKRSDTGVVDVLFSASATSPTMPTNYDHKRRIGSIMRDSGAIVSFVQDGDLFNLSTPETVVSAVNPGTTAQTVDLLVTPSGIRLEALLYGDMIDLSPSGGIALLISDLSCDDIVPDFSGLCTSGVTTGANNDFWAARVFTDTSRQVRTRLSNSNADIRYRISVKGWIDTRGR